MSVVNRLADWPRPAARRQPALEAHANGEPRSAEIVILPCVRRERWEDTPALLASEA